jgi:hypothetical protein
VLYLLAFWLALSFVSLAASRRWVLAASAIGPAIVAAFTWQQLVLPRWRTLQEQPAEWDRHLLHNGEAAFLLVPFWVGVYVASSRRINPLVRGAGGRFSVWTSVSSPSHAGRWWRSLPRSWSS